MPKNTQPRSSPTIGLDVGDRVTHVCVLDGQRGVVQRSRCATRREALLSALAPYADARVILEAGSQSPWLAAALRKAGFAVQVADPRRVALISQDPRKTDRRDAEVLARLGSALPELIGSVHHRDERTQADVSVLRARDQVVAMRARVILQIRGLHKALGHRLPSSSAAAFRRRVLDEVAPLLRPAILPLLSVLEQLEVTIAEYDRQLAEMARTRYPAALALQQVHGVGPITSVAFVLTVDDPARFRSSRQVGSWLGLCPDQQDWRRLPATTARAMRPLSARPLWPGLRPASLRPAAQSPRRRRRHAARRGGSRPQARGAPAPAVGQPSDL